MEETIENIKEFSFNRKTKRNELIGFIIFSVILLFIAFYCLIYLSSELIFCIIVLPIIRLTIGEIKNAYIKVLISEEKISIYKGKKLLGEFLKSNIRYETRAFFQNEKLVFIDDSKSVAVNQFSLGIPVYNDLKKTVNGYACEKGMKNFVNDEKVENTGFRFKYLYYQYKFGDDTKQDALWFLKFFAKLYITIMLIVVLIVFAFVEHFLVGTIVSLGLSILWIIFLMKYPKIRLKKKDKKYIESNKNIGFLHTEKKGFVKTRQVKIEEFSESVVEENLKETHFKPNATYFLKSGIYTAIVSYRTEVKYFFGNSYTQKTMGKIIKFKIEPSKYYVLEYDKQMDEYSFIEKEVPINLRDVVYELEK